MDIILFLNLFVDFLALRIIMGVWEAHCVHFLTIRSGIVSSVVHILTKLVKWVDCAHDMLDVRGVSGVDSAI